MLDRRGGSTTTGPVVPTVRRALAKYTYTHRQKRARGQKHKKAKAHRNTLHTHTRAELAIAIIPHTLGIKSVFS